MPGDYCAQNSKLQRIFITVVLSQFSRVPFSSLLLFSHVFPVSLPRRSHPPISLSISSPFSFSLSLSPSPSPFLSFLGPRACRVSGGGHPYQWRSSRRVSNGRQTNSVSLGGPLHPWVPLFVCPFPPLKDGEGEEIENQTVFKALSPPLES